MRVVVSGGGTGGHIYPALAIARGIMAGGGEVLYMGTAAGLEAQIIPGTGLPFCTIEAAGLKRSLSARNVYALWQACRGLYSAVRVLRRFCPEVVAGTGGYVCGPVVLAAVLLKIPTLIHEQNAVPGLTNRWLGRMVDGVAITFPSARKYFTRAKNVRYTGLPVRPDILAQDRDRARQKLGLGEEEFFLLSFGGSRGARSLNRAMLDVIRQYGGKKGVRVLHLTGRAIHGEFVDELKGAGIDLANYGNITVEPYRDEMAEILAAADLVVARAGAATIAELTVLGKPAILIPYPYATGNHQEKNARELTVREAARIITDRDLTGRDLFRAIEDLRGNRQILKLMGERSLGFGRPGALGDIVDFIKELANRE